MTNHIVVKKYATIDSTNLELKRRVREEDFSANVLIADEQTAGRGRLGRTFESPGKTGLYMSLLLKVDFAMPETMLITAAAAVAVARAIRSQTGLEALIKWVNDIYIDSRKVCGILAEAVSSPNGDMYIILGIGVNVYADGTSFSEEVAQIAGALYSSEAIDKKEISSIKDELAEKIIIEFYDIYDKIAERTFLEDYRKWSIVIEKEIKYFMNDVWQYGKAIDIDDNGALIVETCKHRVCLNTGEITLRINE